MNLALWHWGRRGGGPTYTLELAKALIAKSGVNVSLFLPSGVEARSRFEHLGASIWLVNTYKTSYPATAFDLKDVGDLLVTAGKIPYLIARFYFRLRRQNVVVCTMLHAFNPIVSWLFYFSRTKYILILHEPVPGKVTNSKLVSAITSIESRRADGLIFLTNAAKNAFLARYPRNSKPTAVLPLGALGNSESAARKFPGKRPLRLLFFGRIEGYKGIDLLIEAFNMVMQEIPDRVVLSIFGAGDLSMFSESLASEPAIRVENRWINDNEIPEILATHDVCVVPYRGATQSGVVPVAQAAAMPVVVTPVGGLIEQVNDGVTGRITKDVSAIALKESILSLVDCDTYEEISRNSLEYARTHLGWEATGDELLKFANALI